MTGPWSMALEELRDRCPRRATIVLAAPASLLHFAGLAFSATGGAGSAPWAWAPAALIARGERLTLLVASHHREAAGERFAGQIVTYDAVAEAGVERQYAAALYRQLNCAASVVAAELAFLPRGAFAETTRAHDISRLTRELAAVKSDWEIVRIAEACRLASIGQAAAAGAARPGIAEYELWGIARRAMEDSAECALDLTGDLVSGERAERDGGGRAGDRTLTEGDAVICDLVPVIDGFFGDSCSTILVGDSHSRTAADAAAAALDAAAEQLAPGVCVADVDRAAREELDRAGLLCPHYIGHGVGHSQLDFPLVDRDGTAHLREGHVIALEPGVYSPGQAASRCEHVYLITPDGSSRLTDHAVVAGATARMGHA